MHWFVILLIILGFLGVVGLVGAIIAAVIISSIHHERGDYNDGGGKQVGSPGESSFFTPIQERRGVQGERYSNYELRPLLRNDEYLLSNLLIPLKSGRKVEIDSVIVSRKGIFCIETKNWVGRIYGSDTEDIWVQEYDDPYLPNKEHNNPINQNERHCAAIQYLFHSHFTVEGIVLFVNYETEYYIKSDSCFTVPQFKNYYRELPDSELTIDEVKQIFQKLYKYVATQEELQRYRETLRH